MSERVIALDPGGRSGWAAANMSEDRLELLGSGVLRQDMMARELARQQSIVSRHTKPRLILPARMWDVIVNESWHPRRKDGRMDWIENDPLMSAQHVGQIRLIADLSGARYVEQAPSQKHVYEASMPAVLKALDEYSSEQHDQDARLHLWGYFFDNWFTAEVDPEDVVVV